MSDDLVRIEGLRVAYRLLGTTHVALDGVSLDVRAGESVALIGKSGSGKSTIASALLGLLPANACVLSGSVSVEGHEVLGERAARLRRPLLRTVGYVPQDPSSALNPVRSIRSQFLETVRAKGVSSPDPEALAVSTLSSVGIPQPVRVLDQYPHQLSGGLLQRVLIANAIVARPRLLVADEPTSALDVTTQHEILALIERLRGELGMSVLFITHNLSIAASHSDRIVVLNEGRVVERGASHDVLSAPTAEYTRALVRDIPRPIDEILDDKPPAPRAIAPYLQVRSVTKRFELRGGGSLVAADAVSFQVLPRTTHAVVGESGSGKTTIARIILGLETATAGSIAIEQRAVDYGNRAALREHRRHLQLVFQNPFGSLDPESTIARIVEEPLLRYRVGSRAERRARVAELLDDVGLPSTVGAKKPRELSGGQRQRVSIARALSLNPRMLVLDEPTSALDVSVQAQIVDLLRRLQAEHGLAYLFVSHDLGLVAEFADTLTVMRRGLVVEDGPVVDVLRNPREQYTADLLASTPGTAAEPVRRSA